MSQVMDHIRELSSVIGPRPATTDAEARAAEYIEGVFKSSGLDPERQEFDCPRTRSWAFVVYHVLTIGAAALSLKWGIPALVVALLAVVLFRLDLQMRFSISRFLPRGPSQNIIARHVPHMRRGDRLQRVVIVAHYDSPKASLLASPGLAKRSGLVSALTWWTSVLTPLVILVGVMPFAAEWKPWTGYAALAAAAFLLVPLVMHVYSELALPASEGANDNASGVATLLGVMQATVPADGQQGTMRIPPVRRSAEIAREADVVIEDALLEYRPMGAERPVSAERPADAAPARSYEAPAFDGFDDVSWETGAINVSSVVTPRPVVPNLDDDRPYGGRSYDDTAYDSRLESDRSYGGRGYEDRSYGDRAYSDPLFGGPASSADDDEPLTSWVDRAVSEGQERFPLPDDDEPLGSSRTDDLAGGPTAGSLGSPTGPSAYGDYASSESRSARRSGSRDRGRGRGREEAADDNDLADVPRDSRPVTDWLGIGRGFDVRKAGKKIGSWDNIDEDDEFGVKGGMAGGLDGGAYNVDSASRIRRRVTEGVDRALSEKEIWFVATGAAESGAWGMRALLAEYAEDLRDALIIVVDGVGSGTLSFVTREGLVGGYQADRRLVAQAKRTARENGLAATAKTTKGVLTDALPAHAGKFKAMSVMAFDINGRLPDRGWTTDTVETISEATVERAATFVTELVRDL